MGRGRGILRRESSAKQLMTVIEISPTPIHTIRLIFVPIRTPCKIFTRDGSPSPPGSAPMNREGLEKG